MHQLFLFFVFFSSFSFVQPRRTDCAYCFNLLICAVRRTKYVSVHKIMLRRRRRGDSITHNLPVRVCRFDVYACDSELSPPIANLSSYLARILICVFSDTRKGRVGKKKLKRPRYRCTFPLVVSFSFVYNIYLCIFWVNCVFAKRFAFTKHHNIILYPLVKPYT